MLNDRGKVRPSRLPWHASHATGCFSVLLWSDAGCACVLEVRARDAPVNERVVAEEDRIMPDMAVESANGHGERPTLLSLFAGCGGLDLGFEEAGYSIGLAYDRSPEVIASWNRNRKGPERGHVFDLATIRLQDMDGHFGGRFVPQGVIGGPPCQGFSRANQARHRGDARNALLRQLFTLALRIHRSRAPLDFILVENVPELGKALNRSLLEREKSRLADHGFFVRELELDASMYGVPQRRKRLFLLAVPEEKGATWDDDPPAPLEDGDETVEDAIGGLPEPMHYRRGISRGATSHHRNHWCMRPRSPRFFDGSLKAGHVSGRSFKTLRWDAPSITVAYGHREVHVHPGGKRRLSVYEGMRLQGFPESYELEGSLSSQIDQVSEAVPPPLAEAVAKWIKDRLVPSNAFSSGRT